MRANEHAHVLHPQPRVAHIRYQGNHIRLKCNRFRADILCCIIMAMFGKYHSGAVLFGRYADELVNS